MDKNGESPFKIDENCDILAPGKEILSTMVNNRYAEYEGTSVAAPFVSGTAALLLSIDSSLSPTQMKEILLECAKKNSVKYGLLDAGGRFRFPVKNVYMCSKNMKIVVFIGERDRRGDYDRCTIDAETKKWGLRSINVTHG